MKPDNISSDKRRISAIILVVFVYFLFVGCSSVRYPYIIDVRNDYQEKGNLSKVYTCPETPTHADGASRQSSSKTTKKRDKLIVFVHGALGEGRSTWGDLKEKNSWPTLMKCDPMLSEFDIVVFSYKTQAMSYSSNITEVAGQLQTTLEHYGAFSGSDKQIHFIAHSMGGLVVKRMLVGLNHLVDKEPLQKVRTAFFLGTPATGTWLGNLMQRISLNPQFSDLATADINTYLQTLEDDWTTLMRMRKPLWRFPMSYCAHETESTWGAWIVDKVSAKTYCDQNPLAVSTDHIDIVKPHTVKDEPYPWVQDRILNASIQLGLPNDTVVIMDSGLGSNVYSLSDRPIGATNADRIRDLMEEQDIPVNTIKELVHYNWTRDKDVKVKNPALVIIHLSSFAKEFKERDQFEPDTEFNTRLQAYRQDVIMKFRSFMENMADTDTKFLVYSRIRNCRKDNDKKQWEKGNFWKEQMMYFYQHTKLKLHDRVTLYKMPCPPPDFNKGSESFEDSFTKREFGCHVKNILGIRTKKDDRKCSEIFKPQPYPVVRCDAESSRLMPSCPWKNESYSDIENCLPAVNEHCPAFHN